MAEGLRRCHGGGRTESPRDRRLVTIDAIACQHEIVVESYRERIRQKLGIRSSADLAFRATVWTLMNQ